LDWQKLRGEGTGARRNSPSGNELRFDQDRPGSRSSLSTHQDAGMKSGVAWQVTGVRRRARDTAREAARRSGVSVGEWLDNAILDSALHDGVDARRVAQPEYGPYDGIRTDRYHRTDGGEDFRPGRSEYPQYDQRHGRTPDDDRAPPDDQYYPASDDERCPGDDRNHLSADAPPGHAGESVDVARLDPEQERQPSAIDQDLTEV